MDRSIEMFMNVEKALIHAKCLSMPVILIHPDVDKIVQNRIKDIIKRHQGTLTGIYLQSSLSILHSNELLFLIKKTFRKRTRSYSCLISGCGSIG